MREIGSMACLLDAHKKLLFCPYPNSAGKPYLFLNSDFLSLPVSIGKRAPPLHSFRASACISTDQGFSNLLNIKPVGDADSTVSARGLQIKCQKWDTLRDYPKEDLSGKTVLLRCDLSNSCKEADGLDEEVILEAVPTLSYLISAKARIVIGSHWSPFQCSSRATDIELIADCLSQHIGKTVSTISAVRGNAVQNCIKALSDGHVLLLGNLQLCKEESANNKDFSKELAENIDILVNDAFSISHRVLASTVGTACFTSARLAGLQLERELFFLTKATSNPELPFVAIVGGSRLSQTLDVLYKMLETCSSIVVTGSMVFTFFKALGHQCSSTFMEEGLVEGAVKFLNVAVTKSVDVILPFDLICVREGLVCDTFRSDNVPQGWVPISMGQKTLKRIEKALLLSKMALWIGPLSLSNEFVDLQASKSLAKKFGEISTRGCVTIVGGRQATLAIRKEGVSQLISHISTGGSAFLEMLRGTNLPAVSALDFACPANLEWQRIYRNPNLPLVVDIGCGNGLFIFRMAQASVLSLNFLGLEVRKKLVDRCSSSVVEYKLTNVHFIEADAATMFKRIVSSYPGKVSLVAIQCPVPNLINMETRRRMVEKQLVEQIIHILSGGGKVFLQSDVKSVALQLKKDFLEHGENRIVMSSEHEDPSKCDADGWLLSNPLGHSTDWEDHVLQRGDRMYRVFLSRL